MPGTSLKELQRLNGKPFRLFGFSWDYGGLVESWQKGRLVGLESKISLILSPGEKTGAKSLPAAQEAEYGRRRRLLRSANLSRAMTEWEALTLSWQGQRCGLLPSRKKYDPLDKEEGSVVVSFRYF